MSENTRNQNSGTPLPKGMGKGKTIAITASVAAVAVIAVLVAVIFTLLNADNAPPEPVPVTTTEPGGRGTVATLDNIDEIRASISKPVEAGYYETKMNVEWSFATAQTPSSDAYVANAPSNTHTVYFDLTLSDTGELIYSSPYIPVGAELTDFALDADLEAGDYSAVVTYHLVDEEYNDLSNLSVAVTLHILG